MPARWAAASPTFALKGFDIRIADVDQAHLEKGMDAIGRNMDRQIGRGMIRPEDKDAAFRRISTSTDYKQFADCDLIVEAATENEQVKREIFKKVCVDLPANVLLATNTSSISVTRLASVTDRPGKFMGMHFMNPVPMMGLVELIRGIATEEETFRTVREVVVKLDKKPVNAEDFPAFIVNRILLPMINEAVYALYEGVGNVEAIDTGMKLGANHPMGPLELADFIGLDTCLSVMQVLHEGLADPSTSVPAAGEIRRGRLGRPQGQARLLRLFGRAPGADAVDTDGHIACCRRRPLGSGMIPSRAVSPRIPILRGLYRVALNGYARLSRGRYMVEDRMGLRLLLDLDNVVDQQVFVSGTWEKGPSTRCWAWRAKNGSATAAKRCSSTSAHTGASMR